MLSVCFPLSQLFGALAVSYQASSEVASPESTSSNVVSFFKKLGLDEAMCDAVAEAALAVLIFGTASAVLTAYRKRTKSSQPNKNKLASHAPEKSRPTSSAWRSPNAERTKNPVGSVGHTESALTTNVPGATAMPSKSSQTETDALANAVRGGKAAELPRLLDGAVRRSLAVISRQQSPITEEEVATALLHSALRACAANRCFNDAIAAYEHMAGRVGVGSSGLWSVLLYCIVEDGSFGKCKHAFENLCKLGEPSGHDFVNMVRCFAAQQDAKGLQEMLTSVRPPIQNYAFNRALAACGASKTALHLAEALVDSGIGEELDAVGYNTLMKYSGRSGNFARCFELHAEMIAKGLKATEVTFGILLDACVAAKEFEQAKKVFEDLCSSGLQLNVVHCTTFIKSLLSANKLDEAAAVLREMSSSSGVKPDLITYSTVTKAYSDAGDVCSALKVLQEMIEEGVRADEIIFNSVLTGCSIFPMKSTEVVETFETLVRLGMRPSTTTLSILLKALAHTQAWTTSLQVLNDAPRTFKLEPEARLYVQLCQACVKARASAEVLEVFDAFLVAMSRRNERVDQAFVSRLLRSCVLNGDQQLAAKLRQAVLLAGIAIEPQIEKMMSNVSTKNTTASTLMSRRAAQEVKASPTGSLKSPLCGNAMRPASHVQAPARLTPAAW